MLIAFLVPSAARGFLPVAAPAHEHHDEPRRSPLKAWTEPRTLLVGLFVFCMAFTEGTGNDWLGVAVIDGYDAAAALGALTFAVFLGAMTLGRWFGPGLLDRHGRVPVLRVSALIALVGLVLVVFGGALPVAMVGAALWGLGTALGFPVGMSAAADDPAHAAGRVSVVASIGYVAFLAGPPLIGFIGHEVGTLRALTATARGRRPRAAGLRRLPPAADHRPGAGGRPRRRGRARAGGRGRLASRSCGWRCSATRTPTPRRSRRSSRDARRGADELWSLGDMVGGGPDPEHAVALTRGHCTVALMGNHDYGATGSAEPERFGGPTRSVVARSSSRARAPAGRRRVDALAQARAAPRRGAVLARQPAEPRARVRRHRERRGVPGGAARAARARRPHARRRGVAADAERRARRVPVVPDEPLDLSDGKWLLNPGAVGAPIPASGRWWDALDAQAADGAFWLLLDLDAGTATWRRAPYDPAPARTRARALGLDVPAPAVQRPTTARASSGRSSSA